MGQGHSAEVPTCSHCSYMHRNSQVFTSVKWPNSAFGGHRDKSDPLSIDRPSNLWRQYFLSILFSKSAVPAPSVIDWWGLAFWPPPPGAICPVCQDAAYKVLTTTECKASSGMRPEDWTATLLLFHPLRPPLQEVASSLHIDEDPN